MRIKDILKRKEERGKKLRDNLKEIVKQLTDIGAKRIYLFGSLARGDTNEFSDIDLFVVMPKERSGNEWSKIIYEKVKRSVSVDFIVFNEMEFEEEKDINPLIKLVLSEGKLLFKS